MRRVLAALAALLIAGTAHAFTVSQVKIQPGFFTAGVRVFCAGVIDTTQTLTCQLYIKRANGIDPWNLGTLAFRRVGTTNAFDGIFIGLVQRQAYFAKAAVSSGGATPVESDPQAFTTRYNDPAVKGPLVYISPGGNEANPCTLASPCATFTAAAAALVAMPGNGRGGGIVLSPGIYAPELTAFGVSAHWTPNGRKTSPDSLWHIMGDGTNPDSTIIDYSIATALTWADVTAGDSLWAAKTVNAGGGALRADSIGEVIRGWGDLYPKKTTYAELKYMTQAAGEIGLFSGVRGWMKNVTNDSIIVKTPDGLSPTSGTEVFHLNYFPFVSHMPYIRFSNLTLRYMYSAISPGTANASYRGSGTVFDSCKVLGPTQSGIYAAVATTLAGQDDSITVSNCYINGMKAHLPWGAVGGRQEHGHGLQFSSGFSHSVYNNIVSGFPFGIENFNDTPSSVVGDTITSSDNYIGNNQFINNISSGIDALANNPAWGGRNIIYENNLVRNRPKMTPGDAANWTGVGILCTPPPYGPQWFIRNHVYGTGDIAAFGAASVYIGSTGAAQSTNVFYHNTIAGRGMSLYMSDTPNLSRVISRNNVWAAKKEGGDNVTSAFRLGSADADSILMRNVDLDYDLIDSTSVNFGVARWAGTDGSLVQFQTVSGRELHGIRASYLPVDSTRTSAWPAAQLSTSPTVDAGVLVPGINTPLFGRPRFYGVAPDIGAYEWVTPDSLHMPLNPNNRLWNRK